MLDGGNSDDILVTYLDDQCVDGGDGDDTITLTNHSDEHDLTALELGTITNAEVLTTKTGESETLVLDLTSVIAMTDAVNNSTRSKRPWTKSWATTRSDGPRYARRSRTSNVRSGRFSP